MGETMTISKSKLPGGYGMIQRAVMKEKSITIQAKAIYALLCSYTGSNEFCFPTVETIGKDISLSKPMVIKYLNELEGFGLIQKTKLYPDNKIKNHNKYEIFYLESKSDDTTEVKPSLPAQSTTVNLGGNAGLTNIINNNNINIEEKINKADKSAPLSKETINQVKEIWSKHTKKQLELSASQIKKLAATLNKYGIDRFERAVAAMSRDQWSIANRMVIINRLIDTKDDKRERNFDKYAPVRLEIKNPERQERKINYSDIPEPEDSPFKVRS